MAKRGQADVAGQMVDVTGRIARLYQGPPGEFVAARNALARDLVKAGQRGLAERVRGLGRPSTSAWIVNQLYWQERQEFDALIAAGAAARDAQQARLRGERGPQFARVMAERDQILSRLMARASRVAADAGVAFTADTRQRVRTSLEALALRAGDPEVPHGQLSADVELPGLEALAGLVFEETATPPAKTTLTLVDAPREDAAHRQARAALEDELSAARADLQRLEAERLAARNEVEEADGALEAARLQVTAARRAVEEAQGRLEQAAAFETKAGTRAGQAARAAEALSTQVRTIAARVQAVEAEVQALPTPRAPSRRGKAPN
jgi:hypothetical protein